MRGLWLAVLAACQFSPKLVGDGSVHDDAPGDGVMHDVGMGSDAMASSTAKQKPITIEGVGETIAGFPVWISITGDTDLMTEARGDGSDLYFALTDGTALEWERTAWDVATGDLDAWVRVDLGSQPTTIELRYGDVAAAHAPNPPNVYSNGFLAVWHCDTIPAGTIHDSLNLRNGAVAGGVTAGSGQLANGIVLDGKPASMVTFTNPLAGDSSHTISAWVDAAQPANGFSTIVAVGNSMTDQARFIHTRYNSGIGYGFFGNDQMNQATIDNNMHLVHWVFSAQGTAGASQLYVDGAPSGAPFTHNGTINTMGPMGFIGSSPMPFGPGGNTVSALKGTLDEVRIAGVARDAKWIAAEYANQHGSSFYTIGAEQSVP